MEVLGVTAEPEVKTKLIESQRRCAISDSEPVKFDFWSLGPPLGFHGSRL
jgi:hypothetical protein